MSHLVALINSNKHGVSAHAAGCADVPREEKREGDQAWVVSVESRREAFLEYNDDFIDGDDESNAWPIYWHDCAKDVPELAEEAPVALAPATGTYVKVAAKWTYVYAADGSLLAEIRNDSMAAVAASLFV